MKPRLWTFTKTVTFMLAFMPSVAFASVNNVCFSAIHRVGAQYSVPQDLLVGVALTETGMKGDSGHKEPWPWSVNVEGKGYRFKTRQQAIAFVQKQRNAGVRSIDVGCMQINLRWHGAAFASLEQAFDPVANVSYAAEMLMDEHQNTGDWGKAAGRYHSYNPTLAASYKRIVAQNRRSLPTGFTASAKYPSSLMLVSQTLQDVNWAQKNNSLVMSVRQKLEESAQAQNKVYMGEEDNIMNSLPVGTHTGGGLIAMPQGALIARNERRPLYDGLFSSLPKNADDTPKTH